MSARNDLGRTFNTVCAEYDKWRPAYVPQVYEDIFAVKKMSPCSSVLEIGIGTGQATLPFLELGCSLTAVEPGDHLAAYTKQKFRTFKNLNIINMAFQDFECPADSFDLIYSASAFHWIPEETGYRKVYELLKEGGVFARFANHPYKDPERADLFAAIQDTYAAYMPGSVPSKEYREEDAKARAGICRQYGLTDLGYRLYHRTRTFTAGEYVSLLGTYSDHIVLAEQKRRKFFAEIKEVIEAFGGKITLCDTIDLQLAAKR